MISSPRRRPRIIGALLVAAALLMLGACSVLRSIGYGQAPNLVYWRLDDYAGFDDAQAPRMRERIDEWFAWHRATQLADYAALLARLREQLAAPMTAAQVCARWDDVAARVDVALERAAASLADAAPTLAPAQLAQIERRFSKNLAELRRDLLRGAADERHEAAVKRTVERFEMFYGRLGAAQRQRVAEGVATSPFDAERFVAERAARQQDTLAVLRRVAGTPPDAAASALREVAAQVLRSPRADYRTYQRGLIDSNCAFVAQIHNLTTPEQRATARERLGEWEADLRTWAAAAAPATVQPAAAR